jgi:hypothetical protein
MESARYLLANVDVEPSRSRRDAVVRSRIVRRKQRSRAAAGRASCWSGTDVRRSEGELVALAASTRNGAWAEAVQMRVIATHPPRSRVQILACYQAPVRAHALSTMQCRL